MSGSCSVKGRRVFAAENFNCKNEKLSKLAPEFQTMISAKSFRKLALAFPESDEQPHFENASFKINKKIFATLNEKHNRACVKLNEIDQSAFCSYDKDVMYPVPNKWGKLGWTNINLETIPEEMLKDALETAYETVKGKGKR